MFGFSSGGSSIGGHFSANSFTNSPVSFGGSITQGDMTTGATTQTSSTSSTGGTTSQSLDLSIPPIPALMELAAIADKTRLIEDWRGKIDYVAYPDDKQRVKETLGLHKMGCAGIRVHGAVIYQC